VIVRALLVPTEAEPTPEPAVVKYAYAPTDATTAMASVARRAMPFLDLMNFYKSMARVGEWVVRQRAPRVQPLFKTVARREGLDEARCHFRDEPVSRVIEADGQSDGSIEGSLVIGWRFLVSHERGDGYRWSLVNPAGTSVYKASKGYTTSVAATRAAERARTSIGRATIEKNS
jgi:hypothetical protein